MGNSYVSANLAVADVISATTPKSQCKVQYKTKKVPSKCLRAKVQIQYRYSEFFYIPDNLGQVQ